MVMFGLNQNEVKDIYQKAADNPYVPEVDGPGFFDGAGDAVLNGLETGGIRAVQSLGELGLNLVSPYEDDATEAVKNAINQVSLAKIKELQPDPAVTGWFGQVLHGLGDFGVTAAFGGAAGASYIQGRSEMLKLQSEGVDEKTALEMGLLTSGTVALGFALPAAIPGSLGVRLASGAAINVGIGAGQRGGASSILESNGYTDMAEQYKTLDSAAMFTDAVLGAAFGAIGPNGEARPLPSDVDTALAMNDVHQLEIESAPGIPANAQTRDSHVATMAKATEQMLRGEPLDISETLKATEFAPKEMNEETFSAFTDALEESGYNEIIRENAKLQKEAEARGIPVEDLAELGTERTGPAGLTYAQAEERMLTLPETIMQKPTPERLKLREDITTELYGQGAAKKEKVIDLVLGLPGAGKSSVIVKELLQKRGGIEIDSDMAKEKLPEFEGGVGANAVHQESKMIADELLARAIRNGDNIVHPIIGSDLKKVERNIKDLQDLGYTVNTFLVDVPNNVSLQRVKERYYATGRLIPESYIKSLEEKPREVYNELVKKGVVKEYGHYDNNVREGEKPRKIETTGTNDNREGLRRSGRNEQDASQTQERTSEESDPAGNRQVAEQIIQEKPDTLIPDDSGNVERISDYITRKEAEIAQMEEDSKLFDVAVDCFIRNGE